MGERPAEQAVTGTDVSPVIRRQRIRQSRDAHTALVAVARARGVSEQEIEARQDELRANAETVGNLPTALYRRVMVGLRRECQPAPRKLRVRRLRSHAVTAAPRRTRVRTRTRERRSSPAARRASSTSSGDSSGPSGSSDGDGDPPPPPDHPRRASQDRRTA